MASDFELVFYLSTIAMMHGPINIRFYNLIFKQDAVTAPVISTFSSLSHPSRRPLLEL